MANQYDFTPELKAKILAKIKAIQTPGREQLYCPLCGYWDWDMADGFATVPLLWNVWTNNRKSGLPLRCPCLHNLWQHSVLQLSGIRLCITHPYGEAIWSHASGRLDLIVPATH